MYIIIVFIIVIHYDIDYDIMILYNNYNVYNNTDYNMHNNNNV